MLVIVPDEDRFVEVESASPTASSTRRRRR
jgi:hypothetical protein